MLQAPQRSALSGPALVRLLARLGEADVAESRQSLADRLSQWLGWTDAIALSSALDGKPPAVAGGARAFGRAEEEECTRVRRSLVSAIASDSVLAGSRRRGSSSLSARMPAPRVAVDTQADYAVFRQRYLALQQSMETAIGTLRGRLRALLATQAPALARLAVVDAVMERALGERERTLLGAVPGLLGGHFERLKEGEARRVAEAEAAAEVEADAGARATQPESALAHVNASTAATRLARSTDASNAAAPLASDAWLDAFRKDMQSVLLAELDVRFQPVEGLLAALRAC
ncbi:hypothetical protein QF000_003858 [Paraburkholderia atlantica]|uniref:Uncharacterized protein n=1 Tax=Paraburkholderia atlantica TaxID=2654982 RepID=A0A6I1PTK8_PARAM|nr:DUF3348 domain-containing protein [Paraburkholderia atlantica]MBB5422456.1 hypothetical protein [Paraburkholderia atlantica]MPW05575.1 DUF3348 family protein [Paraburkholderia atlantica]